MLDNQLFPIIINIINAGAAGAGVPGLIAKQAYQPTRQGVDKAPTVYLSKVGDKRLGFPYRAQLLNTETQTMTWITTQQYETTFQVTCLATQNASTPTQYTASDILNAVAYILQNDFTIATFEGQGIGVLRVMDIRNPPFVDDRDRFEYGPSFDVVLTHKQIISAPQPYISSEEVDIYSV